MLRVDLEDFKGETRFAQYNPFVVMNESWSLVRTQVIRFIPVAMFVEEPILYNFDYGYRHKNS